MKFRDFERVFLVVIEWSNLSGHEDLIYEGDTKVEMTNFMWIVREKK